jgi:hypothetical protein
MPMSVIMSVRKRNVRGHNRKKKYHLEVAYAAAIGVTKGLEKGSCDFPDQEVVHLVPSPL